MIQSFDDWMKENCRPPENYSFSQYGRYIEGWRNSMPWACKGMSIGYDRWAESKWKDVPSKEALLFSWKYGLLIAAQAVREPGFAKWSLTAPAEYLADFVLNFIGKGMYEQRLFLD